MISRNYNPPPVIDVRRHWQGCTRSTFGGDISSKVATKITFGGRISLILCIVSATCWMPLLYALYVGQTISMNSMLVEIGLTIQFFLSFPLGWLSPGVASMGHQITQNEIVCYLVLSGVNFFLLGYGIAGVWMLCRRLFTPFPAVEPDPYSYSMNRRYSKAEQPGAGQPATKSADKPPVKDQPSTPTPKDGPQ
jgi:hypothetical protein